MPVTATAVITLKRQYPHVERLGSAAEQQTVRLLWDSVFDLRERLVAAQGTITQLVTLVNQLEADLVAARKAADEVLAIPQEP